MRGLKKKLTELIAIQRNFFENAPDEAIKDSQLIELLQSHISELNQCIDELVILCKPEKQKPKLTRTKFYK